MIIHPKGSRPAEPGPAEYFTGSVSIAPLITAPAPARLRGATVTFQPGARTAWHTHPLGQTLIVTAGHGLAQTKGQPIRALNPGDVIWFDAGEVHWHGATPDSVLTHIALQEAEDGRAVDWLDQVSDSDYSGT